MPATCNLYVEDRENGGFNNVYTANYQLFGYNYDAAGNLLSTGSAYNLVSMTWDAENRISSANGAVYVYDAEGNRVQKQGVSINETVYFGGHPVARFDGASWTDLIYGPTGLLAELPGTENAEPVFHLTDHLGTQVGSVNSSGILTNPLDYTPWGQIFSGSTSDPYFFTGKERDTESGLDYFGARYYASSMGRWMSPDWADKPEAVPYSDLANPQSLNLYGYVKNNPLSQADPDGHCCDINDVGNFVTGALTAFVSDNTLGAVRQPDINNSSYQFGSALRHGAATVQGVAEALGGAGVEAGGFALDATGVGAVVGVPANVAGAGMILHGGGTAATGFTQLFSKRTGDFTKGEKNAMDSKNAADNGGVNKCTNCGQEVQKVQNKAGEPTPGNQLQRHHDPQLSKRPPGTKSPDDRILCKDCHVQSTRTTEPTWGCK